MQQLKEHFISAFKNDYKFLLILSVPALALCLFGLHQLGTLTPGTAAAALGAKIFCEFLFLGVLLSVCQLIGIKNRWFMAGLSFLYYLALTADMVLLWYFKERFGAKYLQTMEGGDYAFLTDWRVITYFLLVVAFCIFASRGFVPAKRLVAARRLVYCAAGLFILWITNPLALLPSPQDFYAKYLLSPSPVYTLKAVLAKQPAAHIGQPSAQAQETAKQYNVWNAKNTGIGKQYKRVVLIAAESFSVKYLHRFNPKIPPQASQEVDKLFETYPSAALKHVTLSTLYGLSVIFTSHPYVKLAYENGYPTSFVRMLKDRGYHTAFLRGRQ